MAENGQFERLTAGSALLALRRPCEPPNFVRGGAKPSQAVRDGRGRRIGFLPPRRLTRSSREDEEQPAADRSRWPNPAARRKTAPGGHLVKSIPGALGGTDRENRRRRWRANATVKGKS